MKSTAYQQIGVIKKPQGLQGKVALRLTSTLQHRPQAVFLSLQHTLVPYKVTDWAGHQQKVVMQLQGIEDLHAAYGVQGCAVFVPTALVLLPVVDCLGYHVQDVQQGSLGYVQQVYTWPGQTLLSVDYQNQELLIPYTTTREVVPTQRTITVCLPTGFIEALLGTS